MIHRILNWNFPTFGTFRKNPCASCKWNLSFLSSGYFSFPLLSQKWFFPSHAASGPLVWILKRAQFYNLWTASEVHSFLSDRNISNSKNITWKNRTKGNILSLPHPIPWLCPFVGATSFVLAPSFQEVNSYLCSRVPGKEHCWDPRREVVIPTETQPLASSLFF